MWKIYASAKGLGKVSYPLRAPSALLGVVLMVVHHLEQGLAFHWVDYVVIVAMLLTPHVYLWWYVRSGNNKKIALNQIHFDFFLSGLTIGVLDLSVVPSVMFALSIFTTNVAVRGFNKLHWALLMPVGALIVVALQGFHYDFSSTPLMKLLSISYEVVHASVLSYVSYLFAKYQFESKTIIAGQAAEISEKNNEIFKQSVELKALNESLQSLNAHLEERVKERTREIELKNEKLAEYAFMNAHKLSEPLSTIVGLVRLLEEKKVSDAERQAIIQRIHIAAAELNAILKEIMDRLIEDELLTRDRS